MGKKDKKKGKGAEKTAAKTEKKASSKMKKQLAALGEDDIETIIAQIEKEESARLQVKEAKVELPSRRINFSFIAHPDKDELVLFGGEYFNGQKTAMYNDLFFYGIQNNTWTIVKAPGCPPPRCGHQMIATSANKGQLWMFGGEFASPTQSQFYHYKDLWVFHLATKQWEKVTSPNGPSPRSGHRMVYLKRQIIVFGGFHDNLRDYKYFNDVYSFNIETYKWVKLDPKGNAPAPRSGCVLLALADGKVLIYGGYSKERIKKDVDKGHVFSDAFLLVPEKNDSTGTKWKWQQIKIGGARFTQRSGMSAVSTANNSAYAFGGVFDVEEEEDLESTFHNELFALDLDGFSWKTITLRKEKDTKSRRRKDKDLKENDVAGGLEEEDEQSMDIDEAEAKPTVISDDGVFTVTVGPTAVDTKMVSPEETGKSNVFWPSARMNCGLALKHGHLYLYGGMFEDGDKQLTLNDFYSLDIHKLDEWKMIAKDDQVQEWVDSDSSEDNSSDDEEDEDTEGSNEAMETH